MFRFFRTSISWATRVFSLVAELLLFCMMLLITVDILGRYFLGKSILVAPELSGYSLVAIVCLSLAYTQRTEGHIQITLVTRLLSSKIQKYLSLFALVISIAFMIWLTYTTVLPAVYQFKNNVHAVTILATPKWIPNAVVPLGFGGLTLELICELVQKFIGKPEPDSSA